MPVTKALSALTSISPSNIQHAGYLAVAKTRATAIQAIGQVVTISRPQLFIGNQSCYELCDMMINEGATKILIVTDSVLKELGIPEKITTYLEQKGIGYHLFDGITPDPTYSVVEAGLKSSVDNKCDAILALGGGSVIDASKIIAMAQATNRKPQKLMGLLKASKCMPLYCVPTTAGTGSEATLGAVISDDKTHQKSLSIDPRMVPLASAVDPQIMKGMPPSITADTGIDVLTHALEAWMSAMASSETDYYAASAARMVMKYLPVAYKDGGNLEAREKMGIAAHYGGIAFNKAGLGYVHAIAHQLGAMYGIPHGRANAIVLPYILDVNRQVSKKRLAELARICNIVDESDNTSNDGQLADYFIEQVRSLIKDLNIDTTVNGMNAKDFKKMAKGAASEVSFAYAVPRYLTNKQIIAILKKIQAASES